METRTTGIKNCKPIIETPGVPADLMHFTRRSLLDWIGKATVLALGGELIAACGRKRPAFVFEPGSGDQPIYEKWDEETVDPQDLQNILCYWQLKVDGLVESPAVFSFAELVKLRRLDALADFHCVEGWSVLNVPWNGVHLSTLFARVKPLAEATYVTFHTLANTYNESLPISVALEPKTLLAYGVDGATLPLSHGFPLRLVVPRKFGYKSAKYVYRLELTDQPIDGYWEQFGYPYEADVPASRLRPGRY